MPKKPDPDQTDRILAAVERLVDKKIESEIQCHREANSIHTKSALGGYLAVAITLGVGAGGIIADTYLKNRDRDDQVLREASQRKLAIISQISGAITSMREFFELTLVDCQKGISEEKKRQIKRERIKREYELVKASRPMMHFFNDEFRRLIVNFLEWQEKIPDYCALDAPKEKEWRKKQREIEEQMVLAPPNFFADSQSHQHTSH